MTEREEAYEVALMRIASLDIGWYDLEDAVDIATKELARQTKKFMEQAKTTDAVSAYCTECGILISNSWIGPKPAPIHRCFNCEAEEEAKTTDAGTNPAGTHGGG